LLLRQDVQDVGLVFGAVPAPQQLVAVPHPADAGVVTRRQEVRAPLHGPLHQQAEANLPVAGDAGVGSTGGDVLGDEGLHDGAAEGLPHVHLIERDAQLRGDAPGALHRLRCTAEVVPASGGGFGPQPQHHPGHPVPLLHQQRRRHAAIHPSAHRDNDMGAHRNRAKTSRNSSRSSSPLWSTS
jgi:hypothetical protein